MSSSTEQQLRDLFAAEAAAAPEGLDLAAGARHRVRLRRRVWAAWTSGAATAVLLVAAGAFGLHSPVPQPQVQSPSVAQVEQSPTQRVFTAEEPDRVVPGGPLVDRTMAMASCARGYSPMALVESAFAFDGTVTGIGPGRTDRRPATGISARRAVTFHVNAWFKGGSGDTAIVDMTQPSMTGKMFDEPPPSYEVGTRLLVTGTPRGGGAPLDNATARGCGFTRYYSPERAAEWAAAPR
jgi:hypothetical protein